MLSKSSAIGNSSILRRVGLLRKFGLAAILFHCQFSWGMDLMQAYSLARTYDANYNAELYSAQATEKLVDVAKAALRPQLSLGASLTLAANDTQSTNSAISSGSLNNNTKALEISLSQSLYDRSKKISISQALLQESIGDAKLVLAQEDLMLAVARRYFSGLAAKESLTFRNAEKTAVQKQQNQTQDRLDVGLATHTDLYDAQARYQLTIYAANQAENSLEDALQAIAEITGTQSVQLQPLAEDMPLLPPTETLQSMIDRAMKNNQNLRVLRRQSQLAEQTIQLQNSARKPTLSLSLSHSESDINRTLTGAGYQSSTGSASLQLSVPIYLGGATIANTERARLQDLVARQRLTAAMRLVRRQTQAAYNDMISTIKQVEALNQSVNASRNSVLAKEEAALAGVNTVLDVLDAQRLYYQSLSNYQRSRYDYLLATLELEKITGDLNQDDLAIINGWLVK